MMGTFMPVISQKFDISDSRQILAFILHYGQLIIFTLALIALFFFYESYVQDGLAKLLQGVDFQPPVIQVQ